MENIPAHLFEWLKQKSFTQLTPAQQAEVLQYFNQAEYTNLHQATLLGHAIKPGWQQLEVNKNNKAALVERLKHKRTKIALLNSPVALWKVAAAFILFGFAFYFFTMRTPVTQPNYLITTDTVYIEKITPGVKIFDTIYLPQKSTVSANEHSGSPSHKKDNHPAPEVRYIPTDTRNLNRLSIQDYNKAKTHKGGSNIKDDSLIQNIGFAHL